MLPVTEAVESVDGPAIGMNARSLSDARCAGTCGWGKKVVRGKEDCSANGKANEPISYTGTVKLPCGCG